MHYAAYGSNLHPLRLGRRLSSAELIGTSFMDGWSLHFHKRGKDESGKCNIINSGKGVFLAIYEISRNDKQTLDRIEGLGFGYSERTLTIPEFDHCVTYIADDTHIDESLVPYNWYKELVLVGAIKLGFPESYRNQINAVATRQDPDPVRRAERWSVVEIIRAGF